MGFQQLFATTSVRGTAQAQEGRKRSLGQGRT
eukprot:CAMPEP_0113590330 /NCGR_PEP_ID=MMETSP0015_2-20120614/36617_1 /TAXON_ID=2838 /ORGANISM="Odontella" /LENGTH=31 /DNA_ID=CAMNT_0000496515 /DNA_START=243 /DNA_END=335 /DNA_ORIENTATION=+ /assembly_acc=CAM_ASM_000160